MTLLVHDVFASFKEICWLFRRINIEKVSQLLVVTRSDNIGELTQLVGGVLSPSTSSKQPEVSQGRAARQHGCARERRGPPPTLKAYVSEAIIYFPKHIPKKNHLDGFASSQQNNIILPSSFTTQVFSPHKI